MPRTLAMGSFVKKLSAYALGAVNRDALSSQLAALTAAQSERNEANRLLALHGAALGSLYQGGHTDWTAVSALVERALQAGNGSLPAALRGRRDLDGPARELCDAFRDWSAAKEVFDSLLSVRNDSGAGWLNRQENMCAAALDRAGELREWVSWNAAASEMEALGFTGLVAAYAAGLDHEDVLPACRKAVAMGLAMRAIDESPVLKRFSGHAFNEKIDRFRAMDQELMTMTRQEIYCRLAARVPDFAREAAQSSGLGVLARGRDAVVVGDPKQMPPTSFFSVNTVDEEHLDEEDLESILDDCLALGMPQAHLLWHYRSRHESLIAFCNRQFYENKLYTFPSVNDRERMVRLVPVEGVFERGKNRQNRAEAEAVVAELTRRAHDSASSRYSVGVVTFNIQQQDLIDDLLTEACRRDETLELWAYGGSEPLFIKNLENVQGDERDVILFSVGYGPDETGRVSMNFGPLNRDGGWRRLNVAVTRARWEMIVFSALKPERPQPKMNTANGPIWRPQNAHHFRFK